MENEGDNSPLTKSEEPLVYIILGNTAELKFESFSPESIVVRERIAQSTEKDSNGEDFILRNFTGRLQVQKHVRKAVKIKPGHEVIAGGGEQDNVEDDGESVSSFDTCDEGLSTHFAPSEDEKEEGLGSNQWEPGPGSLLHDLCGKGDVTLAELEKALLENPKAPFLTNQWGQTPLHVLSENLMLWNSPAMAATIDKFTIDVAANNKNAQKGHENFNTLLIFGIELISINPIAMALFDSEGRLPFMTALSLWTRRQFVNREGSVQNQQSNKSNLLDWMNKNIAIPDKLKKTTKKRDSSLSVKMSTNGAAGFVQIEETESLSSKMTLLTSKQLSFPKAKLTNAARLAMRLISCGFSMTTTRNLDGVTIAFPIKLQQKLRDTICKQVVEFVPHFLPTLFFVEPEILRVAIFKYSPFVRRLLLESSSVLVQTSERIDRPWFLTMLKGKGIPSQRVVDYFEVVSSLTIHDYTNSPNDDEEAKAYESCYKCLRDNIAHTGPTLMPGLSAMARDEIERAASTSLVWYVISKGLDRPFIISFALLDLVLYVTLIMSTRVSLVASRTASEWTPTGVVYFICLFCVIRQLAQGIALFRLSRTIFRQFVSNAWNIFQLVAIVMIFLSNAINDILSSRCVYHFKTFSGVEKHSLSWNHDLT